MSSAKLIVEIHLKFLSEIVLGTGEPCICEDITLPHSFNRSTLNVH